MTSHSELRLQSKSLRTVLIDGDSFLYAAGAAETMYCTKVADSGFYVDIDEPTVKAVATKKGVEVLGTIHWTPPLSFVLNKLKNMIKGILEATDCEQYRIFLSGKQDLNPKYLIDPLYKANRKGSAKPSDYIKMVEYLVEHHNAKIYNDVEAEEVLIEDFYNLSNMQIAAIDKDVLRLVPGKHYNYLKKRFVATTEKAAARNFAAMTLSGDRSDNILGIHRLGELKFDENDEPKDSFTTKEIKKYDSHTDNIDTYSGFIKHYLQIAWTIYCDKLKNLPDTERRHKFTRVCKLLWVPIDGIWSIERIINFRDIFKGTEEE